MKVKILGWAEAKEMKRFGDPNGMAHLQVVDDGTNLARSACGTTVPTFGLVTKEPRLGVRKCERCEAARICTKCGTTKKVVSGEGPRTGKYKLCSDCFKQFMAELPR
jgi:hypothetical protein